MDSAPSDQVDEVAEWWKEKCYEAIETIKKQDARIMELEFELGDAKRRLNRARELWKELK